MRYAHQPYSEIMEMPLEHLYSVVDAIGEIVSEENSDKKGD